jgi:hypothetical protein
MMDGPEDLSRAVAAGCAFGLVEAVAVEVRLAGTRSQHATYRVVVKRRLLGDLPEEVVVAHHGQPMIQAGARAFVGARASNRFSGGWQADYIAPLGDRDAVAESAKLEARLAALSQA